MADTKELYLPPAEFFDAVIEAKQEGKITRRLSEMFGLLAEKVANHRFWIRYDHMREDIISENIYACVKGFNGFSPYKDRNKTWDGEDVEYHHTTCNNPHAWFTTCCFNNLKQFMRKYYNELNISNKMRLQMGLDATEGYLDSIDAIENNTPADDATEVVDEEVTTEAEITSPIEW